MNMPTDPSPGNPPLILGQNLSRRYGVGKSTVVALAGADFTVQRGEFVALVGSSGSGKSTLLNLIGGLDRPSGGRITVDGVSLGETTELELVRHRRTRIGFIFQSFNLLPTLSAVENVEVPLLLAELPKVQRRPRALALLEAVGLRERAEHTPNELSGGEKQRVAIARALANDPVLLLADEPTGNLDSKNGTAVLDLLCGLLRAKGMTMLIVTHDLQVAARADRKLTMKDGFIQAGEPPAFPTAAPNVS